MTMRVPNLMNNAQSMLDLQRIKQQYAGTALQVSSGKAIVNLGDDPAGTAQIMNDQTSISRNADYLDAGNTATAQMQSSSEVLTTMGLHLDRLLELGQEGLGGTATADSQAGIATEVDALRTDLISLGNTQASGKYIFAGTKTTTAPFVDGPGPDATTVTYNGNDGIIKMELSPSVTVATNIPGSALFFGPGGQGSATDLLAQTAALRDGLLNNDREQVQTAYRNLQTISGRLNVSVADLGDRENGVAALDNGLTTYNQNLTNQQSTISSVDYPKAITQLNEDGVAQQATLNTVAKTNAKTLFDYIV
jgi:flagellar hook-associated protein 3 FlgL